MTETISSASNPKIRRLLSLQQKSSERRESGLFVLEGMRELDHCLSAGYSGDSLFFCPEILGTDTLPAGLAGAFPQSRIFRISPEVYSRVAYRGGTEGVIAEMRSVELSLDGLELPERPLILVAESVEKPGNIGAMLRSCDAAGADAMIICGPGHTDLYNPNIIRASIGAVFTVPCVCCSSAEAIAFLKSRKIRILTAQLQDSELYYDCGMREATALVMGTESEGLSREWRDAADAHIRIPMLGRLDSLNVSVSAAVLLFEAVRQRTAE